MGRSSVWSHCLPAQGPFSVQSRLYLLYPSLAPAQRIQSHSTSESCVCGCAREFEAVGINEGASSHLIPKFRPGCVGWWAHTGQFENTRPWWHDEKMKSWQLPPRALESSCTCCLFVSRVLEHLGVPELVEILQVDHHCLQRDIPTTVGGNVWCSWGAKTTSARYFTKEWSVRNLLILLYGRNGPLPEMASFDAKDAKPHHRDCQ